MTVSDYIVISVIAALAALAVVWIIRRRRKGKDCSCGCESCPYPCQKK